MQADGNFKLSFHDHTEQYSEMACPLRQSEATQESISFIESGFTSNTVQIFDTPHNRFFRLIWIGCRLYVSGLILVLSSPTSSCATGA
ncbi:hypothetical protein IG631_00467 [Alternaria alternata]|nr:hypothetical protein IG631_00467 [Alternaria alternata]